MGSDVRCVAWGSTEVCAAARLNAHATDAHRAAHRDALVAEADAGFSPSDDRLLLDALVSRFPWWCVELSAS